MAGTWQPLTNQPPFQACTMLLLTDGSVFVNGNIEVEATLQGNGLAFGTMALPSLDRFANIGFASANLFVTAGDGAASLQHTFLVGPSQPFEALFHDNEGGTVNQYPRHEKFLALNDMGRGTDAFATYDRPLHLCLPV